MSIESPQTRDQIVEALAQQERVSAAYWSAFDTETFLRPIGTAWSPAENVRHLTKSVRPLVKALGMPGIVLRFMFGKAGRPSMTYDGLRERYLQGLAEGGQAGRFAPSHRDESDREAWRQSILSEFSRVNGALRKAIGRWSEEKLDRLQLPHPLLGKLTVREMLFFTLYHERHHMAVVERRMNETAGPR